MGLMQLKEQLSQHPSTETCGKIWRNLVAGRLERYCVVAAAPRGIGRHQWVRQGKNLMQRRAEALSCLGMSQQQLQHCASTTCA